MADSLREQLVKLASKIEGRTITINEASQLEAKARLAKTADKAAVEQVLAEALNESPQQIRTKLAAAHDDTDRIVDDIVNELKKSK